MKRPFLIEEIMLDGVSGEVRGTIEVDLQSNTIEQVHFESFCFRRDDIDCPTVLDPTQVALAKRVIRRLLEAEYEIGRDSGRFVASAEEYSPPPRVSAGTRILAEYLESAGRKGRAGNNVRRAL